MAKIAKMAKKSKKTKIKKVKVRDNVKFSKKGIKSIRLKGLILYTNALGFLFLFSLLFLSFPPSTFHGFAVNSILNQTNQTNQITNLTFISRFIYLWILLGLIVLIVLFIILAKKTKLKPKKELIEELNEKKASLRENETLIDIVIELLKKYKKISLKELIKGLEIDKAKALELMNLISESGLAKIKYGLLSITLSLE